MENTTSYKLLVNEALTSLHLRDNSTKRRQLDEEEISEERKELILASALRIKKKSTVGSAREAISFINSLSHEEGKLFVESLRVDY